MENTSPVKRSLPFCNLGSYIITDRVVTIFRITLPIKFSIFICKSDASNIKRGGEPYELVGLSSLIALCI